MSTARNRGLSAAYYEAWNGPDLSIPDKIFGQSFVINDPGSPVPLVMGPEGVKGRITDYHAAFPDLEIEVHDVIAEADKVATRWTLKGTQLGRFAGYEPTRRRIEVSGITVHRISGGLIAEGWVNWDTLGLRTQILGE